MPKQETSAKQLLMQVEELQQLVTLVLDIQAEMLLGGVADESLE